MNLTRRTFLKTGGTVLASLFIGGGVRALPAAPGPSILPGREIPGRCPLCSVGCGVIYRSRGHDRWFVEGDPDCPVGAGSLCSRGAGLVETASSSHDKGPLYRAPGKADFEEIGWDRAVHILARRLKDFRERDLGLFSAEEEKTFNRFDSLAVIAGGSLTNEEAYTVSKLFRALGVGGMDTTVRASHGMAVAGVLDVLGLPAGTHPLTQVAFSDVVVLLGCNPGQTAPALCRFLDEVRKRRGTVIVVDPRRTETMKKDDLWLQLRPGSDTAVLGAFMQWILKYADIPLPGLVQRSDAPYIVLSEIMGEYERHEPGRNRNRKKVDETLSQPNSIFQRMKEHFGRYNLDNIAGIAGVDIHLLRRACTLVSRTARPDFSAAFVIGSGTLASPSGSDTVRLACSIQALLGNLGKKGGGIIFPAAAGNAQGVCDMGLLASFLPGYIRLPRYGSAAGDQDQAEPLQALLRAWYPGTSVERAQSYLPHLEQDQDPSLSTIIQGIGDEQYRAFIAIGSDPLSSMPDNSSTSDLLDRLDLLVVMDAVPNRTSTFWKRDGVRESSVKTEVLFIPTRAPALKSGSMTDPGRRVRMVRPLQHPGRNLPGLLNFMVDLGNSIRSKYRAEGGKLPGPIMELDWQLTRSVEDVAAEINGWRPDQTGVASLPPGKSWEKGDRCGNRLYRGWTDNGTMLAGRRDPADDPRLGLYEKWGWFWPRGVADPFSWIEEPPAGRGVFLRRQGGVRQELSAADVLPIRPHLPVRFWRHVEKGSPFPEHYEPFHSPLSDSLTGGRSNPHLQLRHESDDAWGYLSRRPEEVLTDYPVIITMHRTGNVMGTGGGITAVSDHARELGTCRIIEIGKDLARSMKVRTGERLLILSPYSSKGVIASAHVTARIGAFADGGEVFPVASLTLYGDDDRGANELTPPAFDFTSGGMEVKVFMGRLEKAQK